MLQEVEVTMARRHFKQWEFNKSSYIAMVGMRNDVAINRFRLGRVETIIKVVCEYFDISEVLIKCNRRDRHIVFPRQIAMYLMREYTNIPLKEIGRIFGGKDHTSVIHSTIQIKNLMQVDDSIRTTVQLLENKIQ